jgi:hypothetical protein
VGRCRVGRTRQYGSRRYGPGGVDAFNPSFAQSPLFKKAPLADTHACTRAG